MRTPILIIGGGPVGMVLAMNLNALGVGCIIVNDEQRPRWHPKGSTQNSRTLEHYRRLGIVSGIRELGLPPDARTDVGYFTRLNGWELARIRMPSEREKIRARDCAPTTDQVPEPIFRCNQMHVEAFLHAHLATLPNVEMRYGWRCVDWCEEKNSVIAVIEEVSSGRRERIEGAYLAACDGGQSGVRRKLGIRYHGENLGLQPYLGGPMVSSYVRSQDFFKVVRQPCWQYWAVNCEVRSNVVSVDGITELLFNTRLERLEDKPNEAVIARAFLASVGAPIAFEFAGHETWTAGQALVADSFGTGRVALAGDAVHLFTPTGGFGMNTGVDDAANLGWKLAAMMQGWGGTHLIASYEAERRPIALRNTGAAKKLARHVGNVPVGAAIEHASPAGDAARREASVYLATFGQEFGSLGVQLGARYDGSPIIVPDSSTPPSDNPIEYVPSACPGGRAPHVWLADRSSLFDHFGTGFTLLRLQGCRVDARSLEQAAAARGVPLKILDIALPEARELYQRDMALIRPDQHVAWRGNRLPDDCDALLARVTGWSPERGD